VCRSPLLATAQMMVLSLEQPPPAKTPTAVHFGH